MVILKKNADTWELPITDLIEMIEEDNTLITINDGTFFVLWNMLFKFCNNACIMPGYDKQFIFNNFYSVV